MLRFLAVCLGGAIGTGARYLVTMAGYALWGERFPVGTLAVNVGGCFFMGIVARLAVDRAISDDLRLFLGTGLMGGLTTYSAFNSESLRFLEKGEWGLAGANFFGTTFACLAAGIAGMAAARWFRP